MISNKATNQIPELAVATADVRMTIPGSEKPLEAALQAKVASSNLIPDTTTTKTLVVGRPAFLAGPRGHALGEKAQAIYRELDQDLALVPMTGAATDADPPHRSGKPVVVESFGLAGVGYHARDEYIELDSIVPRLYLRTGSYKSWVTEQSSIAIAGFADDKRCFEMSGSERRRDTPTRWGRHGPPLASDKSNYVFVTHARSQLNEVICLDVHRKLN